MCPMPAEVDLDTTREPLSVGLDTVRRGWILRTLFAFLIFAVLLAACFDYLGFRSRTLTQTTGRYTSAVTYGQFTRRGITTPLDIEIQSSPGTQSEPGFDGDVKVSITASYVERFSLRQISPQPDSETSKGDVIEWTFQQPEVDRFSIHVDSNIDAAAVPGWVDAEVEITVNDQPVHTYTFRTWIWP
jgi:hypothetical protein